MVSCKLQLHWPISAVAHNFNVENFKLTHKHDRNEMEKKFMKLKIKRRKPKEIPWFLSRDASCKSAMWMQRQWAAHYPLLWH